MKKYSDLLLHCQEFLPPLFFEDELNWIHRVFFQGTYKHYASSQDWYCICINLSNEKSPRATFCPWISAWLFVIIMKAMCM